MTLAEHCERYVMSSVLDANPDLAREYAAYVVNSDEAGDYGALGANHATEWPAWSAANTRECLQCGARYAHRIAGTATYECGSCGCAVTR